MNDIIKQDFNQVYSIIDLHRKRAFQEINNNSLMTAWNVGGFVSDKLKSSQWGSGVVAELSEYLRSKDPTLKSYSKRTLYRMVQFYETYSTSEFIQMLDRYKLNKPYISPQSVDNQNDIIMPTLLAQLPNMLMFTNWSNHIEILTSCKTNEERIFYILYAKKEKLKVRELQRAIKTNAFESILGNKDYMSEVLKNTYPDSMMMFKDKAYLDFLGLPQRYKESKLRKGIVTHIKDFILELGKDFLFVDQEHQLEVGGKIFKCDLLFFHRGLQCLVAIELKTKEFEPAFMGQLEFYLEALDQNEKRSNENPSIGILLCKEANREVVKYAMNRSLSPAMVAEYKEKLIPQEVLQRTLEEFVGFIDEKR